MSNGIDAKRIAYSLATSQEGVLSRSQLLRQGVSVDAVKHWLKTGYVFRFLPGVYSLGRPAETKEAYWMAGVLHAGAGSLLAGQAAACFWDFCSQSGGIEIVRPIGVRRQVQGFPPHDHKRYILRKASIVPDDFFWKGSLPVMDPARVMIDLSGFSTELKLRRYFIEAGRNGLLTSACLNRMRRRSLMFKNRKALVRLIELWDPTKGRIRSILEGEFKLVCAEGSIKAPHTNCQIGRYEVDAVWFEEKVIVELDGRKFHSDAEALSADSEKTRYLRSLGYTVLRFTWNDVIERPEWVLTRLKTALGSGQREIV